MIDTQLTCYRKDYLNFILEQIKDSKNEAARLMEFDVASALRDAEKIIQELLQDLEPKPSVESVWSGADQAATGEEGK